MSNRKDNTSAVFLLPCLQISVELRSQFLDYGFDNSYMFCDTLNYHFTPLYLCFNPGELDVDFYRFVLRMEKNRNYVETIDIPGGVIIVYRIPKRFRKDYLLFLKGRYSSMSSEFKSCFLMKQYIKDPLTGALIKDHTGKHITEHTMFYHIFNRTERLREKWEKAIGQEIPDYVDLYEKYDTKKETLIYKQ